MKFSREARGATAIRRVETDSIRIGNETYTGTVAITTTEVIGEWLDKPVDALQAEDLEPLLAEDPEIVVIGTGARGVHARQELTFALARRGIGLEMMDTAAAARTFNVLVNEGRNVAAVLYL